MKLTELISGLDCINQAQDLDIESIKINTKADLKNSIFICIKGLNHDTHNDIQEIIEKNAAVIVCDKNFDASNFDFNFVKVENTRYAMSVISANFCQNIHKKLKLVGVTGTNGKTSIVHLINNILLMNGKNVGTIGTLGNLINNEVLDISFATSTTPDPIELHEIFSEMHNSKAEYVVMETTSHAFALNKLDNLDFEIGIFTNLTQDHLDFHKTFENYLEAKQKLFDRSKIAVVNIDDSYSNKIIERCKNKLFTYGIKNECDFKAENISYLPNGIEYDLKIDSKTERFFVPIPGEFSVYNSLAAIASCLLLGLNVNEVKEALKKLSGVPGRMQLVENKFGFNVVVDYAHTPDSLINILKSAREFTKGKLITVAGCGGDRDSSKRPIMGKAVFDYSDICIYTSDNPRSEEPDHILIQMVQTLPIEKDMKKICRIIADRREAIKTAIELAKEGDTVILAGKGHEDYQELKNKIKIFFDDTIEAKNALKYLEINDFNH